MALDTKTAVHGTTTLQTEILTAVRHIFPIVAAQLPKRERWRVGGFLCFTTEVADLDAPFLLCQIGWIERPGKAKKYRQYAPEKVRRLRRNFKRSHVSSWQSRNEKRNHYGGAIRVGKCYLSFSGLPEKADEALCLFVAMRLGWIDKHGAIDIALKSRNRFFLRLLEEKLVPIA